MGKGTIDIRQNEVYLVLIQFFVLASNEVF